MKVLLKLLNIVVLTAAGNDACFGAAASATPQSAPVLVGDYSHQLALVVEGNQTFTKEQILSGMKFLLDYHVASHPAAPLGDYTMGLERDITLGYRRAGFPSVMVKAAADTNARHIVIKVVEGPRYRCGDILLSGVKTMTNEVVRQKIADVIGELETGAGAQSNLNSIVWLPDHPAPLDDYSLESLAKRVQKALAALNYYQPKVSVRIVPDPARMLADLSIEIADKGIKGTVTEIEVSGLYTSTRPQLLDYLKLKPGVEASATLVAATSNQLWLSARFFRQDVALVPLPTKGQFKLKLDLDEVREAPPLNQEFSRKEKAMLKFREWLAGWETRGEDFVVSVSLTNSTLQGRSDLVLSPSGTALAVRDAASKGPASLQYALVASKELVALYSVRRQSKFTMPRINDRGFALLKFRPPSPKSYGNGDISFGMMMGFPQKQPLRLEIDLQPAVFLSMAHWMDSSLKDGVLTASQTSEGDWKEIRIEIATGRLLQASRGSSETNTFFVQLHSEEGAFAQLNKEIAVVTAGYPNRFVTNRGLGSWASFMTADVLTPPVLERALAWFDGPTAKDQPRTAGVESRPTGTVLALARGILGQRSLDTFFEPLNRLFRPESDHGGEEVFVVSMEESPANAPTSPLTPLCVAILNASDTLVPRDSWPWVLLRESAFTVAGQGNYTQGELDKLLKSEDVGPMGCLTTAYLLGKTNPKLARTFAERGLARLNLAEFQRDYQLLLRTNSIVGDLAGNALSLLAGANEAKLTPLLSSLAPDESAFLRQLILLLAEAKGKGQPPADAMWHAFDQYWEKIPRRYLELGLNQFLPQVQSLTNSQALFERGRMLLDPDGVLHDPDEAAQCMRKAADMGHAGAQVSYGHLCEAGEGVPQNLADAMRWYRKAAGQKQPHALCSIATLYHFGKGVPQDRDEAARFYRLELATVEDCVHSQFSLGQIYEVKNEMDEALKWYRRAATEGAPPAQAKLGDLLSDGFFTKPDYVEACQWLSLAAAAGDKISEVRLRRVKTKLTAGQLDEVAASVTTVTQRLEEKQKAQKEALRTK